VGYINRTLPWDYNWVRVTWGATYSVGYAQLLIGEVVVGSLSGPGIQDVVMTNTSVPYSTGDTIRLQEGGAGIAVINSVEVCRKFYSCRQVLEADPSLTDGTYTITTGVSGGTFDVFCDMTNGGLTRVLYLSGSDYSGAIITSSAVGTSTNDATSSKLSDADINFMNELDSSRTNLSPNYFKYTCGSFTRYLYIAAGFTSIGLDNDDDCGYQLDRNLDGVMDCEACRSGFGISD
jgi:hypothetical protein